jgi:DNA polymerase-3 subunit alpha
MYLSCHSCYSFRYGILSVEDLLREAVKHGVRKFTLTDINNTSGILDFHRLAPLFGIEPLAGIDFRDGAERRFIGIAKNHEGFNELNKFLTACLQKAEPGLTGKEARMPRRAPVFENAFVVYDCFSWQGAERRSHLPEHGGDFAEFIPPGGLRAHEFIGIRPGDLNRLKFSPLKNHMDKLVALVPVTFRNKVDFNAHRLLRAMDNNTLLSKLPLGEQALADEMMKSEEELRILYRDFPKLIYNTKKLMDACEPIDFAFGKNKNRHTFTGSVHGDQELLIKLCHDNLEYRYPKKGKQVIDRFNHEIELITRLGFSSYFLINWDIVRYAQSRNFFYVGRGSGANSMVAYLLRITDVDPIELDLYFERFINAFRTSPPDFDIDFSWKDRDEITEYIFKRNLMEKTCLLGAYSTFQAQAVVRELGKVFGLPKREIDVLQDPQRYPPAHDHITKLIYQYARVLHDLPNHLTIHASGILISEKPMTYYTALANPPKGFPLAQFSMLEAEDAGFAKFDILSQRGLGHIKDTVEIIRRNCGQVIDIHDVKRFKKDKNVEQHLTQAKLMGCFYVESPAMRMLLTKLRAKTYLDLVAASSIIRPGVAQSGMMQEYIRRFHDPERAKKAGIPQLLELMPETFGVMVYQEDVIKVAHHFAGLTLAEADRLRRGMNGKYKGRAEFRVIEQQFFDNCKAKGYDDALAKEVWREIESFAGYAFAKGHSASFAVESYQSMFLKAYFPREFMVGVINNHGGFYSTEYYLHEARMAGATIHAPHINHSEVLTCIHGNDIYLGLELVKDLEAAVQQTVVNERNLGGEYSSLENFMKRVSIPVEQLRLLIRVGAFRFTGKAKQQLLWDVHAILGAGRKTEARRELFDSGYRNFQMPALDEIKYRDARDEMELLGFPLCSPFELIEAGVREHPALSDSTSVQQSPAHAPRNNGHLPHAPSWRQAVEMTKRPAASSGKSGGRGIEIIGYYVTRKPTLTKKGEPMMFGCFLDRQGCFFDTNHFPESTKKFPFRGKGCYLLRGTVAEEFGFYSVNVEEMHKIEYLMYEEDAEERARSRPDPVVVPPVVARTRPFDYLLVISPPPHVWKEVELLKKKFHRQFDHYAAVTAKPQITLCHFSRSEAGEKDLIRPIAEVTQRQAPVRVTLRDFDVIPRHTVYIRVLDPDPIIELAGNLKMQMKLPPKTARFVSNPHLAIACGLDKEKFSRAATEFSRQNYTAMFIARSITLLRKEAQKKWARYEVVKEFTLEGKQTMAFTGSSPNTYTTTLHQQEYDEPVSE